MKAVKFKIKEEIQEIFVYEIVSMVVKGKSDKLSS